MLFTSKSTSMQKGKKETEQPRAKSNPNLPPGGRGKLTPAHNPKPFTSENQPANKGRKEGSRPWRLVMQDLLDQDGFMNFDNVEVMVFKKGKWVASGKQVEKVRVKIPTQQMLVMAAFNAAMKGKMDALKLLIERMDGAVPRQLILTGDEGGTEPIKMVVNGVEVTL